MKTWKNEMRKVAKLKKTIYKPPLPLKKQRITAKAQRPGKVKMFSEEEIFLFKTRRFAEQLV